MKAKLAWVMFVLIGLVVFVMMSSLVIAEEIVTTPTVSDTPAESSCGLWRGSFLTSDECAAEFDGQGAKKYLYQCYDKTEGTLGDDSSCKSKSVWQALAEEECSTKCPSLFKEQVKCVFDNSNDVQKCYTSLDGVDFRCYGKESCLVDVSGEKGKKLDWKGSCEGESGTIIDGENEEARFECAIKTETTDTPAIIDEGPLVIEEETCVFVNSDAFPNECYTDDGKYRCTGDASCSVKVTEVYNKKLDWKSSCGAYSTSIVDGETDKLEFNCLSTTAVKESVTCYFQNSNSEQECYSSEVGAGCKGVNQCSDGVSVSKGKEIIWKSSCGGYQYTVQDGQDEKVVFECGSGETTSTSLTGGYRYSFWQCYDGKSQNNQDDSSCKSSGKWKKYASEFCNNRCANEKCGVSSFSVSNSCYYPNAEEETSSTVPSTPAISSGGDSEGSTTSEDVKLDESTLVCKDSCPLDGKCYQFGYRKDGKYCTDKSSFELQLKGDLACDNNFECSSNVCVNNKCLSPGLIDQILNWFKRLFGG